MSRRLTALIAGAAAVTVAVATASAATRTTHNVGVGPGNVYNPATLSIMPGDSVHWMWAQAGHTVTSGDADTCTPDGVFDSGFLSTGQSFDRTFNASGIVEYFCTAHCELGMKGILTVGNPTAAAVRRFSASSTAHGARLRWSTGTETGLLGFHVYRARGVAKVRIDGALIPAYGTTKGHSYSFVDRTARRGRYYLQVVSTDGRKTWLAAGVR